MIRITFMIYIQPSEWLLISVQVCVCLNSDSSYWLRKLTRSLCRMVINNCKSWLRFSHPACVNSIYIFSTQLRMWPHINTSYRVVPEVKLWQNLNPHKQWMIMDKWRSNHKSMLDLSLPLSVSSWIRKIQVSLTHLWTDDPGCKLSKGLWLPSHTGHNHTTDLEDSPSNSWKGVINNMVSTPGTPK